LAFRPLFFLTIAALSAVLFAVVGLPPARADDGDGYEGGNGAVALGWAAIGAGALGTGSLVAYKMSRKVLIATVSSGGITRSLTAAYKPALNFHMAMNLIGYASGMVHGLVLSRGADGISIGLAIMMTILVATGVLMKFTTSRTRLFNMQVHGQVFLVVLMVILVLLHIATADD
jgi:hypothetical protein